MQQERLQSECVYPLWTESFRIEHQVRACGEIFDSDLGRIGTHVVVTLRVPTLLRVSLGQNIPRCGQMNVERLRELP